MIRAGIQDWWFCSDRTCKKPNRVPNFAGTLWTRMFLERWTRDWRKGHELRRILTAADRGRPVDALSDEDVVAQVAQLILKGDVHIHASAAWVHVEEAMSESGKFAASGPPPFPLAARSSQPVSDSGPGAADDPATFSGPIDPGAQVAALMAASEQGAPFCPA